MIFNRWVYMLGGILFFIGMLAVRNHFILQSTGSEVIPSVSTQSNVSAATSGVTGGGAGSLNNSSIVQTIPQAQSSSPQSTGNSLPQPAVGTDPTTLEHTSPSGGRTDIEQIGGITVSQQKAYTGDEITFTVTIKNTASYKKFVRQLCWESSEGNFGCLPGFNLDAGQVFTISNNGRFSSSGTKSIWVMWTQDNTNFYLPINNSPAEVQIL